MRATYVKPALTPASESEVSLSYKDAIWSVTEAPPDAELIACLHAHGALETGHFKFCYCNNAGNIKATTSHAGFFTCITLNEVLFENGKRITYWFAPEGVLLNEKGISAPPSKGGRVKGQLLPVPDGHPYTRMRAYPTLAAGIEDKIRFLLGDRWKHCLAYAAAGDPAGYVESIRDMGYFTADLAPYSRAVVLLYRKFLPLAQGYVLEETGDEAEIDACIAACSRFEVPFFPDPNWDAVRAERDAAIKELE